MTRLSPRLRTRLVWLLWLFVTAATLVAPLAFGAGKGGLGNVAIAIVQLSFMTVGALIADSSSSGWSLKSQRSP